MIKIVDSFVSRNAPTIVLGRIFAVIFNRIIDLENLGLVLNKYGVEFKNEVIHRLGVLNVWCPVMPDGRIELDLAAWDNREACKLLIRLAVIEPGENWCDESYFPSVIEPELPGIVMLSLGRLLHLISVQDGICRFLGPRKTEKIKVPHAVDTWS